MPNSVSGFGQDYEKAVGLKTASRLLAEKPIPRTGYETEVFTNPNARDSLRLGNFSGQLALFSLQPKGEWMRLYGINPEKV